jgi:hypothetical protein
MFGNEKQPEQLIVVAKQDNNYSSCIGTTLKIGPRLMYEKCNALLICLLSLYFFVLSRGGTRVVKKRFILLPRTHCLEVFRQFSSQL